MIFSKKITVTSFLCFYGDYGLPHQ